MTEYLRSRIIIKEPDPNIRTFPALPSAVLGVVGVTKMGPMHDPTLVTSYAEFESIYGGFINNYYLALSVRMYFLNGGKQCYVSRTCHHTGGVTSRTNADATTGTVTLQTEGGADSAAEVTGTVAGPWELESGDTLIGNVEGLGTQTATFTGTAGSVTDNTTYPVPSQDGLTILLTIDGGSQQTITFSGAIVTAAEIVDQINAQIDHAKVEETGGQIKISSDKEGTDSSVSIDGGTSGLTWDAAVAGGGNVADIKAVTISEVETIVEAAWTNGSGVAVTASGSYCKISTVAVGATVTLQVDASSSADDELGLDNDSHSGADATPQDTLTIDGKYPGGYTDDISIQISDATDAEAEHFNLYVNDSAGTLESFVNMSMLSTDERYAVDWLNNEDYGSIYVAATDEGASGTELVIRPDNTSGASMSGGDDGLTDLDDTDFIGDADAETGVYALNAADDVTLLAVPDRSSITLHDAMTQYCLSTREQRIFAILDPPASYTATQIVTHKQALTEREIGGIYWPRVKILNPSTTVFGSAAQLTIPPSCVVAGVMARNDQDQTPGPFFQPAGTEVSSLYGVVDLETEEAKRGVKLDLVFPKRVNPITYLKNYGIFIDGARTLKGSGNFPSVGERRGVSYLEKLMDQGLQWVRHRNNTVFLRKQVERQLKSLLYDWMLRDAFQTRDPNTAFYIDVSDALNSASVIRSGKLKARVGLATNSPTEWVILEVTKDTRAYDEELATA